MQVINGNMYREATLGVIKYKDLLLVDGFIANDVIPWVIQECEVDKDLSFVTKGESQLKNTKDVLIQKEVIDQIYCGLQVYRIKKTKGQ